LGVAVFFVTMFTICLDKLRTKKEHRGAAGQACARVCSFPTRQFFAADASP
jgi:hypothetical protein